MTRLLHSEKPLRAMLFQDHAPRAVGVSGHSSLCTGMAEAAPKDGTPFMLGVRHNP
jgi:hypothetical protein